MNIELLNFVNYEEYLNIKEKMRTGKFRIIKIPPLKVIGHLLLLLSTPSINQTTTPLLKFYEMIRDNY